MKKRNAFASFAVLSLMLVLAAGAADTRLSSEDVVAKHLASIGTPQAREAAKSRLARGDALFEEMVSGKVKMQGKAELASMGRKVSTSLVFGQPSYPAEKFVFDGSKVQVAMINPGSRSNLGNFLNTQTDIMNDGLLGGVLFTGWPLAELKERQAKIKYEGTKKVDNRELHELSYTPKKRAGSGDLTIRLYFEPDTFRHVLSVYNLVVRQTNGDELRETLEERFDDFQTADGLTLPRHWELRYRKEPVKQPQEYRWDIRLAGIEHNTIGQ